MQTFRSDYIGWCLPLFGSSAVSKATESSKSDYYSCSFLATEGSMFFVNHTASTWDENECCLFAKVYNNNKTTMYIGELIIPGTRMCCP